MTFQCPKLDKDKHESNRFHDECVIKLKETELANISIDGYKKKKIYSRMFQLNANANLLKLHFL
ncbi:hypothetical protein PVIIG_05904 [Plasmodium vivax India VII]|uniref:Uncharacterized protein n=1 Tax=Plasmodium vivax India VII TaxID=1077284 RepID=A0A0J9S2F5_PLAVI|nr:hypothetical protein PVIIG_05904 [Plasmodium vivax India VII]